MVFVFLFSLKLPGLYITFSELFCETTTNNIVPATICRQRYIEVIESVLQIPHSVPASLQYNATIYSYISKKWIMNSRKLYYSSFKLREDKAFWSYNEPAQNFSHRTVCYITITFWQYSVWVVSLGFRKIFDWNFIIILLQCHIPSKKTENICYVTKMIIC